MIYQPRIYFPVGGEKGNLCFNDLNTPKFNRVQEMPILTTGIDFKFLRKVNFNYKKI